VRRRVERLLQAQGALQRGRAVHPVELAHRFGDLDEAFAADRFHHKARREKRRQEIRRHRFFRRRVQHRAGRDRHIGVDVVPGLRQIVFRKDEACAGHV
jgi:hypothetical protein